MRDKEEDYSFYGEIPKIEKISKKDIADVRRLMRKFRDEIEPNLLIRKKHCCMVDD